MLDRCVVKYVEVQTQIGESLKTFGTMCYPYHLEKTERLGRGWEYTPFKN